MNRKEGFVRCHKVASRTQIKPTPAGYRTNDLFLKTPKFWNLFTNILQTKDDLKIRSSFVKGYASCIVETTNRELVVMLEYGYVIGFF